MLRHDESYKRQRQESIADEVNFYLQEIDRQEDPGRILGRHLANFIRMHLALVTHGPDIWPEESIQDEVRADMGRVFLDRVVIKKDKRSRQNIWHELIASGRTEKFISESQDEFQKNIAHAILESGVEFEVLKRYLGEIMKNPSRGYDYSNLTYLILPVYTKLREMGYSHEDLTA